MSETLLKRLTAGLGGMAVALLLIGLVVQRAQANATPCSACVEYQKREGLKACEKYKTGYPNFVWSGCMQGYNCKCYSSQDGGKTRALCPDNGGGTLACNSPECRLVPEDVRTAGGDVDREVCGGVLTDMGGGSPCANSCLGVTCERGGYLTSSKTCNDTQ